MSGVHERQILKLTRRQIYPRGHPIDFEFAIQRRPIMDRKTPVGSIGSCFAAHVKNYLVRNGFNYVQTSDAPGSQIGSAAWGTVYNTFCLSQEFARAHGDFSPTEKTWADGNGGLLDPYRKNIGWPDAQAADRECDAHAEAVRRALETARVFILTAGLTEIWYAKADGSVFFQVPPARTYQAKRHGFRLASVDANAWQLSRAIADLRRLSPDCHVVLTVSPVPLRATFRSVNVVTANTQSKATLLAAVHEVTDPDNGIHYFPSYEMVTVMASDPFKRDNRHVRPKVIERVMKVFTESFVQ